MDDALKTLELNFQRADADLRYVYQKLESDFSEKCRGTNVNPIRLLQRIKKLQEDLPQLRSECEEVIAAKQDLVDSCQALLTNRNALLALQQRAALNVDSEQARTAAAEFVRVARQWNEQAGSAMAPAGAAPTADLLTPLELNRQLLHSAASLAAPAASVDSALVSAAARSGTRVAPVPEPSPPADASDPRATQADSTSTPAERPAEPLPARSNNGVPRPTRDYTSPIFQPISEAEFDGVSVVVRGRCKLPEVNLLYERLFQHFKDEGSLNPEPLTVPKMVNMGCKVTGATGEARLQVLRSLKLVKQTKKGITIEGPKWS